MNETSYKTQRNVWESRKSVIMGKLMALSSNDRIIPNKLSKITPSELNKRTNQL